MIENTPEQRREIAEKVNGTGKKNNRATWIYSTDELIEQFREYARLDLLQRYDADNLDKDQKRNAGMAADMYADLSAESLRHNMPALIFLFKRYLTQR